MRLLVVEDDVRLCDVLRRGLGEQGHVVDVAHDGEEGQTWAEGAPYDAVILDVNLPKIDGLSVVRSLRKRDVRTPVLMLTSRDTTDDVIAGLDAGADDYLRKPFVFGELEARLRTIVRRRSSEQLDAQLCVRDLVFDLKSRRARRGQRQIDLTAREAAFLEYFMRNAGRLITRSMIEDALFERESETTSNVVEVYVSRLRSKMTVGREAQLLHTIRGAGYRFGER
ncbi:MAG TPA: response regulator transcription factor [Candidatus Baltobacteraceae bacterium]|nr:response regulator transcription factor [Candidatus Baltobacteraceae bacterium]